MSPPIALIFGYGARVGVPVASRFASQGYRVAIVSRSQQPAETAAEYLALRADLRDPATVENVFATVVEKLGHPSVVVYNASGLEATFDKATPATSEIAAFQADYNANVVSAYIAARLAVDSFNALDDGSKPGTYIYTGNKLNFIVVPTQLSQGAGKAGGAHMINYLAMAYKDEGHRFYYADEREPDGNPTYSNIDGPAHADFYSALVQDKTRQPWLATFVKGKGYVDFHEAVPQEPGALLPPKEQ